MRANTYTQDRVKEVETYRSTIEAVLPTRTVAKPEKPVSGFSQTLLAKVELAASLAAAAWVFYYVHLGRNTVLQTVTSDQPLALRKASGRFWWGIGIAIIVEALASAGLAAKLWGKLNTHDDFTKHLTHRPLDPKTWRPFQLVRKILVSPNVYRLVFALPHAEDTLGLPTGQHIALRAIIDGKAVSRSYTPVSNNGDLGRVELLVKVYDQGLMTKHLESMQVGDTIDIRGPKGAMQYSRQYAKHIGMIAGGTGITPMFQLIRAICADEEDTTSISLLYASRNEEDILLRDELDSYALRYPHKFRVSYVLSAPPEGWKGQAGRIDQAMIREQLPTAGDDTKVLLCGPPLMVEAMKKHLTSQGFKEPGLMSRPEDQVFVF